MADIKISQLYQANQIARTDQLPIIVGTSNPAPCNWNTKRATVEMIVSGGFSNSAISRSIADGILQSSASLSVVNLWTSSLSESVQAINIWSGSVNDSIAYINAWTGSNTSSFAGTSSYALVAERALYVFNLQEVTTAGNVTTTSIDLRASLMNGQSVSAVGLFSHAQGNTTIAQGQHSHAEGQFTTAVGASSHAEGQSTKAIGLASHAEGQTTTAIGNYSHAEGFNTTAVGIASHARGRDTITSLVADYSNTSGRGTVSNAAYQTVVGQYNIPLTGESAFVIGNGANSGAPSNLLYADDQKVQITGSLDVTGSIILSTLKDCINDAAATAAGVPLWGLYRNNNVISIRVQP